MLNLKVDDADLVSLPNFFNNQEHPLEAFSGNTEALPALEAALSKAEARVQDAYHMQIAKMFDQMYSLGASDRALKEEQVRLRSENVILKNQITQLTITFEEEWYSRSAKLSSKIDAFCQKFILFHNSFTAECQPALQHDANLKNYYKTYDKNRDNYSHWLGKECGNNFFKLGEWEETAQVYHYYNKVIGKYLNSVENLSLTP